MNCRYNENKPTLTRMPTVQIPLPASHRLFTVVFVTCCTLGVSDFNDINLNTIFSVLPFPSISLPVDVEQRHFVIRFCSSWR